MFRTVTVPASLASDAPTEYHADPLEYFGARLATVQPLGLSHELVTLVGRLVRFVADPELPDVYASRFLATARAHCIGSEHPAGINTFFALTMLKASEGARIDPLIAELTATGDWQRLHAALDHHLKVVAGDPAASAALAASPKHHMYLPPSLAGGPVPVVMGEREGERRARAQALAAQGAEAASQQDFAEAADAFASSLAIVPDDFEVMFHHAQCVMQAGSPAAAIPLFEALCSEQSNARNHSAFGAALASVGRLPEALQALDQALELEPTRAVTVLNKTKTLLDLGDSTAAASFVLPLIDKPDTLDVPDEYRATFITALLRCVAGGLDDGDLDLARQVAAHVCVLAPEIATAWYFRGEVARKLGDDFEALEHYGTALSFEPSHKLANAIARVARNQGLSDVAIAAFERYLETAPEDGLAWNDFGIALGEAGDQARARDAFTKAVTFAPDEPLHWSNLGGSMALDQADPKQLAEALECFNKAVGLDPNHPGAVFNRAAVLLLLGRVADARTDLLALHALHPGFPQTEQLLAHCERVLRS